ncbi:MAG: hypothetical protein IPN33_03375 [Saprospiraceae bacterium]|nr:hypothetical protein [Saprospiraceae bacterium]
MPKAVVLAFLFTCSYYLLPAQHLGHREVLRLTVGSGSTDFWQSTPIAIPLEEVAPFLSFFVVWQEVDTKTEVRFSADGQRWENWQP